MFLKEKLHIRCYKQISYGTVFRIKEDIFEVIMTIKTGEKDEKATNRPDSKPETCGSSIKT
jgi:hypothetical protein